MDIILMENVEKLGTVGDVVKVKNGYARNYLLPRQLGMYCHASMSLLLCVVSLSIHPTIFCCCYLVC